MLRAFAADAPRLVARRDRRRFTRRGEGADAAPARRGSGARPSLAAEGREFGDRVAKTGMRPEMIDRLQWHAEEGHEIVIVSASLDVYIERTAERARDRHGALQPHGGRRTTAGSPAGSSAATAAGPAKLRRIREHFGERGYELWAYGDSAGDAEMLAAADHPVRIHRRSGRFRIPTP